MSQTFGKIPYCPQLCHLCHYECCAFTPENYVVLYPGEWERAEAEGYDLSAFEVLDVDFWGGRKVRPRNLRCCQGTAEDDIHDRGGRRYKPFECRVYPLWPRLHNGRVRFRVSARCPIDREGLDLFPHAEAVLAEIRQLIRDERVAAWFSSTHCYGTYLDFPTPFDEPTLAQVFRLEMTGGRAEVWYQHGDAVFRLGAEEEGAGGESLAELLLESVAAEVAAAERVVFSVPVRAAAVSRLREVLRAAAPGPFPAQPVFHHVIEEGDATRGPAPLPAGLRLRHERVSSPWGAGRGRLDGSPLGPGPSLPLP